MKWVILKVVFSVGGGVQCSIKFSRKVWGPLQGSSVRKTCRIARTHVPCPLALLGTTTLAVCPFFLFRTRGLSAGRMGEEGSSAPSRSQGKSYLWKQPLPFALVPQPGACSRSLCFSSHGINPAHAFPFLPGFPSHSLKFFCFPVSFHVAHLIPAPPVSLLPPNMGIYPGTDHLVFFFSLAISSNKAI